MKEQSIMMNEVKASPIPTIFKSVGIGSCVTLFIYDCENKIGGGAHVMLPERCENRRLDKPSKYAKAAVTILIGKLKAVGANMSNLKAKITGGSNILRIPTTSLDNLGERNVSAIKAELREYGISLAGEDTGGIVGRKVVFNTENTLMRVSYDDGKNKIF